MLLDSIWEKSPHELNGEELVSMVNYLNSFPSDVKEVSIRLCNLYAEKGYAIEFMYALSLWLASEYKDDHLPTLIEFEKMKLIS